MKSLHGEASAGVGAPIEECLALLAAVERYPSWYPDVVRQVDVLERRPDGLAARAEVTLHVAHGPLVKDLHLLLAVRVDAPDTVVLTRIPHGPPDDERFEVTWRLQAGTETSIHLALDAELAVPRFVPLGGVGDTVASGFVAAAVAALRR
jgi:ribosome-associated toxin RatA of RatAB toxin-antitoxin module